MIELFYLLILLGVALLVWVVHAVYKYTRPAAVCARSGHRWCVYGMYEDKCLRCDLERPSYGAAWARREAEGIRAAEAMRRIRDRVNREEAARTTRMRARPGVQRGKE